MSAAVSLFLPQAVKSATLIWDADGTSGSPVGGPGTWNTDPTPMLWDNAGTMQAWDNGGNHTAVFGGTAGTVTLGTSITAGGLIFNTSGYTIAGADTLTLAGPISVATLGHTATISTALAGTFSKTGSGTLDLTGDSTLSFLGAATIESGTLRLSGSGSLAGASGLTLSNRGTLTLDNTTTNSGNRVGGTFASSGGTINFLGHTDATAETIGPITLNAGALTINTTPGGGTSVLTIPSITRNVGGTLYVNGPGLGGGTNDVILTTAPALANNILKYAVVNNGSVARFATHGGNGTSLAPMTDPLNYKTLESEWTGATVNALPGAPITWAGGATRTAYSLTLDNGIGINAPTTSDQTLTLSGAVLQTGGSSTIAANAARENILAWGTNEAIFITLGELIIQRGDTSILSGSGGLTKSGPGVLQVHTANAITGTTRINEGTYRAIGANSGTGTVATTALGNGSVELNGGNIDLRADVNNNYGRNITVNADALISIGANSSVSGRTHQLSALTFGANRTLTIQPGANITADTAYGLSFTGNLILNAPATINIANNGTGTGTVSFGIATGTPFPITKQGAGDLITATSSGGTFAPDVDIQGGRFGWNAAPAVAGTMTHSGVISGSGSIFKVGTNANLTVNLTGANTFTGGITLGTGTFQFGTASNIGGPASNLGRGSDITMAGVLTFIGSTSQSTNRPITFTANSTLNASGTSGATITYSGVINPGAFNPTFTGTGAGFISGGLTQATAGADGSVSGGNWTFDTNPVTIADDLTVVGASAVLNINTALNFGVSADATLQVQNGATINLGGNEFAGQATGLDRLLVGQATTGLPATFNLNSFALTTPRFDLGQIATGLEGSILGTGTLTVTSDFNLYRGTIATNLAGAAAVEKLGGGVVTFSGDNSGLTSTTAARVDSGDLILDYTTSNTTKLNPLAGLDLRGGNLILNGNASAPTTQTVASLTLATLSSMSRIELNNGTGQTITLELGAITRSANQGTIRFDLPELGAIRTLTANLPLGILGAYATVTDGTGTYFARNDGANNIAPLTYLAAKNDITAWLPGEHITDDTTGYHGTLTSAAINSLRFNAAGPSTVTLAPAGALGLNTGGILQTAAATASVSTISGGRLASGTNELIFTVDSATQNLHVSSTIGGTTTLTKTGNGTLELSGSNTSTGTILIHAGTIIASGGSAINDTTAVTLSDDRPATLQITSNETIGSLSGGNANAGQFLGTVAVGGNTLTLNSTASTTYSGVFTGNGTLIKTNAATDLTLTGISTGFTGTVKINGGGLVLSSTGQLDASAIEVNKNGHLHFQNTGFPRSGTRVPNTTPITLNSADGPVGGTRPRGLSISTDQPATTSEDIGDLNFNSGSNYLLGEASGTSGISVITASNFVRNNNATVNATGRALGSAATADRNGFRIASGASQVTFLGTLVGGGGTAGASAKNVSIVPWAIGENLTAATVAATNMGNTFVTYVSNNGFTPLNLTNEFSTYAAATATDNTRESLTTNLTGLAGKTVNSLIIHNNVSGASTISVTGTGVGQALAISSGALMFTANTAGQSSAAVAINLGGFNAGITVGGTNEYVIHVVNPSATVASTNLVTATISSPLTSAADITKSGRGTLVLTAMNTAGGGTRKTTLNEGILEIGDLDHIGGNTGSIVFAGGTLRLGAAFTDDVTTRPITILPGGATIDTNGLDFAFANSVGTGTGGFTKTGLGKLTLNAAAGYTGNTVVTTGTLALGADDAIGTGDLSVTAEATLDLGSHTATAANLTLPNTATNALTGTGTLTVGGTAIMNRGTVEPALAGTMNLIKQTASQTLTLSSNASSFTGFTHVQEGTLSIASLANAGVNSSLGAPLGNNAAIRLGNANVAAGLLYTGAGSSTNRPLWLTGIGGAITIDNDGTGGLTLDAGITAMEYGTKALTLQGATTGFDNVLNGGIDQRFGTISLTKAEAGTWVLGGVSTYTGINTISGGTLQVNAATGGLGDSTASNAITLAAGTTLRLTNNGTGNDGTIIYGSASNPAGYDLTLTGSATIHADHLTANTGNIIALDAFAQATAAARTLNVTGGNGYALRFSSFGLSPGIGQTTTLNPTTASIIIAGNVINPMSGFTLSTQLDTLVLDGIALGNVIEGSISDAVGATPGANGRTVITKSNTSTWRLNGTSTYTGATNLNGGILIAGNDSALGTGTLTFAGGTLDNGNGHRTLPNNVVLNAATPTLTGTGNFSFPGNLSQTGSTSRTFVISNTGTATFGDAATDTVTLADNNVSRTLTLQVASTASAIVNATVQDGPGTGADNLTKTGPGSLTFNASNTYTGTTVIDNGTLEFNADQTLTGALTVGAADTTTTVSTLDFTDANATFGGAFLVQTNSTDANTIKIGATKTLTIGGNFTIGGNGTASTTVANFTGGGSLVVNNTAASSFFTIGGNDNAGNKTTADLSGLGSLSVSLNTTNGTFRVNPNNGTNVANFFSTLILPTTTTVTAHNLNVGDNGQYAGNLGDVNTLRLGSGVNTFNVNNVNIGTGSRDLGAIVFHGPSGSIKIRDASGSGPAAFNLGTGGATTTVDLLGNQNAFDVRGHDADLLFGAVAIGTQNGRADDHANVFGFDQGTLVMSGLTMSTRTANTFNTTSTMHLSGGMVTIGSGSGTAITLATHSGSGSTNATINITGGTVSVTGAVLKGAHSGTGTSSGTINLNGGALDLNGNTVGSATNLITFNAQSGTLSNLAQLNGGANLVKTTAGTLTLGGTNTYTGATLVQEGVLALRGGASNRIPTSGSVVLGAGTTSGVLQLGDAAGASNQTLPALTVSGTGTANAVVGGNAAFSTLTLNIAGSSAFPGAVGGAGANQNHLHLFKTGAGDLTLSGANSYAGSTTVSDGTLNIDSATGLGTTSNITVSDGSALNLLYSDPAGNVVYTPTGSGNVLALEQSLDLTVIGFAISGAYGSRINLGTNTLSHTGTITTDIHVNSAPTVSQYVLIDSAADGTFTGPGSFVLGTIFNGGNFIYSLGRDLGSANDRLLLNVTAQPAPLDAWWKGDLTGTGTGIWNASAMGGNTNWDSSQTGGVDGLVPPDENSVIHFSANGAGNFATELGVNMTVKKVIFEASSIGNNVSLGGPHTLTIGSSSVSGSGGLTIAAGNGAGTIPISAPVNLGVAQSWNISDATSILALSGGLTGTGPFSINDDGTSTGTLIISGTSATYTGGTNLVAGKLVLDGTNRLPTTTELTMGGATTSATLQLGNGNASNTTISGLASGAATGNTIVGGAATASTLTINQTTNGIFNGVIGGAGATDNNIVLIKGGPATLTLNGVNTYTGATTVNNGSLQLGPAGGITQSASLAVNAVAGATASFDVNGRSVALTGGVTLGGADSTAAAHILDTATGGSIAIGGNVVYSATNNPAGSIVSANFTATGPRNFTAGDSTSTTTELTLNGSITATGLTTDQRITFDGTGVITLNGALTIVGGGADAQMNATGSGTLNINAATTVADDWVINTGTINANAANALNAADDVVIDGTGVQDSVVVNIGGSAGAGDVGVHQGDGIFVRNGARVNVTTNNGISAGTATLFIGDSLSGSVAAAGRLDLAANITTASGIQLGGAGGQFGNITGTGTISAAAGAFSIRTGTIGAGITFDGAAPITKVGDGTVTFAGSRALTATGGTNIQEGQLILDYTTNNNSKIGGALTLGASTLALVKDTTLTINGNASAATLETMAGTTILPGDVNVVLNSGSGQTASLALGSITRTALGGTVAFDLSSAGTSVTTTSPAASALGWATVTTGGTTRLGAIDGSGSIVQATMTPQNDITAWDAGDNIINTGALTGTVTTAAAINSLTFDAPAASTIALSPGTSLNLGSGGILVNSDVGANASAITGGKLFVGTGTSAAELVVHHNGAGSLSIGSDIVATGVTKSGGGLLALSGTNRTGSRLTINEGTVQISGGRAISDNTAILMRQGATLDVGSSTEVVGTLGESTTNLTGGTIAIGAGGSLTVTQAASSTFSGTLNGDAAASFTKMGTATLTLSGNSSTSYTGTLNVRQGQVLMNGGSGRIGATTIVLTGGELLSEQDQGSGSIDRIANGSTITLNHTAGTNGLMIRTNQGGTRTDTVTTVALGFGHNVVTAHGNATNANADLAGTSFLRGSNHATALVRGNALGATTGTRSTIRFTTAPLGGAGADGTGGNLTILPWLVGDLSQTGLGNTFVTSTGASNSLRPLAATEYTTDEAGFNGLSGSTANNIRFTVTPGAALTGTPTSINSLVLDSAAAIELDGPASALEITSGAILAAGTGNHTLGGFSGITSGAGHDYIVYVTTAASTLTLDSPLTSTGVPLVKAGAGTLRLDTTGNAFNDLYINQGTVAVNDYDKLGSGAVNFAGGTLRLESFTDDLGGKTFNLLSGNNTLDIGTSNLAATNWILTGPGNLTKTGTGTVTISGGSSTTHTGLLTWQQGTLQLNNAPGNNAIGSGGLNLIATGAAAILINQASEQIHDSANVSLTNAASIAALWNLDGHNETIGGLTMTTISNSNTLIRTGAGGVLTVNGDITFNHNRAATGNTPNMLEISGTGSPNTGTLDLGGAVRTITVESTNSVANLPGSDANIETVIRNGGIIKEGSRTLFLSGTNTYAGSTTINAGTLSIGSSANLGDGSATNTLRIALGGTLQSTGANVDLGSNRALSLGGTSANIDVTGANLLTLPGVISGGDDTTFNKIGTGSLLLAGENTYEGPTQIVAGTLGIGHNAALGAPGEGTVVSAGATLALSGNVNVASEPLSLNGLGVGSNGALRNLSDNNTFNGPITLASDATIQSSAGLLNVNTISGTDRNLVVNGAGDTTISGSIATGIGTVTKNGTGTLTLSGSNSFSGGLVLQAGVVSAGANVNFGDTAGGITFAGGTFAASDSFTTSRPFTLTATATINVADTKTFTASGSLSGSAGLIKSGQGTLVITSDNSATYSGQTTINEGTYLANNFAGSAAGDVTVNLGATFGGTGSVSGAVLINSGATISPGASIESLGVGSLSLADGAEFKLELQTSGTLTADHVAVAGALSLSGNITLAITDLAPGDLFSTFGDHLTFITYAPGGFSGTGLFVVPGFGAIPDYNGEQNPSSFTFAGREVVIDYNYGPSQDQVALVVVPEPGSLASLAGAAGCLLGLQRFRRRKTNA